MLILISLTVEVRELIIREKTNLAKFWFNKKKIVHLTVACTLIVRLTNISKSITRKTINGWYYDVRRRTAYKEKKK